MIETELIIITASISTSVVLSVGIFRALRTGTFQVIDKIAGNRTVTRSASPLIYWATLIGIAIAVGMALSAAIIGFCKYF